MAPAVARYDGHADWYDEVFSAFASGEDALYVRQALALATAGYASMWPVAPGFELKRSAMRAGPRSASTYRPTNYAWPGTGSEAWRCADACFLPVRDESVTVALGAYFHTDVEDFASVVADIARCLRPRGSLRLRRPPSLFHRSVR